MSSLFGNDFPCCTTDPEDTAVSHVDEPQPPMPAEGASHAFVVVQRTHSVNADRPEWAAAAYVISEHDHDEIAFARARGRTLIPIGPDGDTGTRAITEPEPTKPALEMVEDALYRNPAGGQVRVVQMLRNPLAPGMWSAMVPGIFGDHYAEVTAEGLAACGYTLVTEEPRPEYPTCGTCGRVQVHGTVYAECECP